MGTVLEEAPPRPEPSFAPPSEPAEPRPDRRWVIDVAIGVVSSLVVGLLLAGYQAWIDDRREQQTQAVETERAERDQVLANVQFIRETIRDAPDGVKPFRGMNLRDADLSGWTWAARSTTRPRAAGRGTAWRRAPTSPGRT